MTETGNIYDWLDEVQKRPNMWLSEGADKLKNLETLIHGYYSALSVHNIAENVPPLNESRLADWLHQKTGIGGALGWAHIVRELHPDPEDAFKSFFEYLKEYRRQNGH